MADVAKQMGIARSALYKLWDTHLDYSVDLGRYLAMQHDYARSDDELIWNGNENAPSGLGTQIEALRAVTNAMQNEILADVLILVRAASLGSPQDESVHDVRCTTELRRIGDLADWLSTYLHDSGATIAHPLDRFDLALGFWCLSDGFGTLGHSIPSVRSEQLMIDDGQSPRPWGLWSYGARSLILRFTQPRDTSQEPGLRPSSQSTARTRQANETWSDRQVDALAAGARLVIDQLLGSTTTVQTTEPSTFKHLTIARIARSAGVSRRAVYDVWPTKAELLTDLLRDTLGRHHTMLLRHFDRAVRDASAVSVADLLATIVDEVDIALRAEATDLTLLMAFVGEHHPTIRTIIDSEASALIDAVADRLDRALRSLSVGLVEGVSTRYLAAMTIATIDGLRRLHQTCPQALELGVAQRTHGHSAPAIALGAIAHQSVLGTQPGCVDAQRS